MSTVDRTNLLFSPVLNHGGIETLVVRLSTWLVDRGETVVVAMDREGELQGQLPDGATCIVGSSGRPVAEALRGVLRVDTTGRAIRSFSFTAATLVRQLSFHARHARCAAIASGVFHETAYTTELRRCRPAGVVNLAFNKLLPDRGKWFMNGAVRRAHEARYSREFPGALVAPIPVDICPSRIERRPRPFEILSVGRLVSWKTYNLGMIEQVAKLRALGRPLEWVVVGDGPARPVMVERVRALGLDSHVHFLGTVEYSRLPSLFSSAWVFVGVGTSMLEAAAAGIPAICALAGRGDQCYGFADEVPEPFCVGEQVPGAKTRDLGAELEMAIALGPAEYHAVSERMVNYSRRFSAETVGNILLDWVDSRPGGVGPLSPRKLWPVMVLRAYQTHLRRLVPRYFLGTRTLDR